MSGLLKSFAVIGRAEKQLSIIQSDYSYPRSFRIIAKELSLKGHDPHVCSFDARSQNLALFRELTVLKHSSPPKKSGSILAREHDGSNIVPDCQLVFVQEAQRHLRPSHRVEWERIITQ